MMNIVVVGGGAGGLELATSLGRKLGKKNKARITLVDRNRTHLWKPLLHEVATGSMDAGIDALSYQSHAKNHGFEFQLGSLTDIKRDEKRIVLAPIHDESGALVVNEREVAYDILVMAIGSVSNDFNTKGIKDHCIFLDSPSQAHRFYNSMMNRFLQFATEYQPGDKVKIAIVGGGATGVELSAELYNAVEQLYAYGFKNLTTDSLKVTLVEAGPRILPALPERISGSAHQELVKLGVDVRTATMITISVFGSVAMYIISLLSLFILRQKEPNLKRPFKVMYPIVPAVSMILALFCLYCVVFYNTAATCGRTTLTISRAASAAGRKNTNN